MYRNAELLALIRLLPCQVPGCGAAAPSEAMHNDELRHGKGRGLKADDSASAAGCPACHYAIGHGSTYSYEQRRELFNAAYVGTMSTLIKRGWLKVAEDGAL